MKHIKITLCALGILVALPLATYAETETGTETTSVSGEIKQEGVNTGIPPTPNKDKELLQKKLLEEKREALRLKASSTLPAVPKPPILVPARIKATTSANIASTTRMELKERLDAKKGEIDTRKEELRKKTEETRKEVELRKEEIRKAAEEKREEFKARLDERRQENIKRFANQMFDRFDAAIERLNKLADRIESRLDKLEEAGRDVDTYRDLLEDARAKIELAIEANEAAEVSIEEVVVSDDPKTAFEKCRGFTKEVVEALKAAHQALVDVIAAIKAEQANADDDDSTATTTTATTTTQ